jgi:acetyl/propionyl-CoA carboxylase alpha subunit
VKLFAHSNGHDFEFDIQAERDRLLVRYNGKEVAVTFDDIPWAIRTAFVGDRRIDFGWDRREEDLVILIDGIEYDVVVRDPKSELLAKVVAGGGGAPSAAQVRAPIPGLISKVLARPGEAVKKDQTILCLDAMKLENEIASPRDGVLKSIEVQPGQPVEKGQTLFVVD